MAKEFNMYTYPTFFFIVTDNANTIALSVDDIMNNDQSNMKIIFLISAFIIIILVYGLVKTRKRKIVINELGLLITEKERNMKISWEEISHIFFCSTPFLGLYIRIIFTNQRDSLIIYFGKSSLWSVNFYRFRIAILAFSHKKRYNRCKIQSMVSKANIKIGSSIVVQGASLKANKIIWFGFTTL